MEGARGVDLRRQCMRGLPYILSRRFQTCLVDRDGLSDACIDGTHDTAPQMLHFRIGSPTERFRQLLRELVELPMRSLQAALDLLRGLKPSAGTHRRPDVREFP